MPIAMSNARYNALERARAESNYNWAVGGTLTWQPDEDETALYEKRMAERYRAWARTNLVTYAASTFVSASRRDTSAPFETVNPINETVELPDPYMDKRTGKWVVPKNVFDKNVLSRRRFLFEIDGMKLDDQKTLLEPLLQNNVIQRVVFSGNKSLHCVIEEADEPDASPGEEMYKWVWRFLARTYFGDKRFMDMSLPLKIDNRFPEVVDNRCGHPSRTTRSPFAIRKDKSTGENPVEQKLLYFENVRADSGWRAVYERVKAREEAEQDRMRRRAAAASARAYREPGKKKPNAAAERFMSGDLSDGWKHASLPSAVGSLKACGYSLDEIMRIFDRYSKELKTFALHCWDYFEKIEKR